MSSSPTNVEPLLEGRTSARALLDKASIYHGKVPGIRKLPLPVLGIIFLLIAVNVIVWVAVGIVLASHPTLASTATLAYTLGLRHALDADHISAIDLMTRRLIAAGQRPVTVGTIFLSRPFHVQSSPSDIKSERKVSFTKAVVRIVIITSIVVAATAAAISDRFDGFSRIGGIIGTSVSAAFLIILSIMNMYILYRLIKQLKRCIRHGPEVEADPWAGGGCLFHLFKKMFKLIDRPWKMYPLGVLFGLGFDTSSEVALLGIASIQAAKGTSIWLILIFPILFTAGMCLIDTTDGALMMTLYTSTGLARDHIAILYYSIVLTVITVIVAMCIGVIQLLSLILNVAEPTGRFWDGVSAAGDHYDIIGGSICASFVVFGALSAVVYGPWRRWLEKNRRPTDDFEGRGDSGEIPIPPSAEREFEGEGLEASLRETPAKSARANVESG